MGEGDTIVITIDGLEVGRLTLPKDYYAQPSNVVHTINLSGKAIAEAILPDLFKTPDACL